MNTSPFSKIFASLVREGKRTIEEVPSNLLEEVLEILNDDGKENVKA